MMMMDELQLALQLPHLFLVISLKLFIYFLYGTSQI